MKAAFRPDQDGDRPAGWLGRQHRRRGRRGSGLVAEDQPALRWPVGQQRAQGNGRAHLRNPQPLALLGRLGGDAAQPFELHPLDLRAPGQHRLQQRGAKLARLLGDQIDARALHRREAEPEVRFRRLRPQQRERHDLAPAAADAADLRAPLAVAAIEQRDPSPRPEAEHGAEVMRLLGQERYAAAGLEGRLHVQAVAGCIHGRRA
jgi:hypothetical protein